MSESTNKLTQAYNRTMERVHLRLEELEEAEKEVLPRLQKSIEHATETAVELQELTRKEAHLIGAYVKRDLQDAGHYLAQTGSDIGDWLRFDVELVENRLLELFRSAADKTSLELLELRETLEEAARYQSGEITGPGTLQCDSCGEQLAFHATSTIPACPRCGATVFSRMADTES